MTRAGTAMKAMARMEVTNFILKMRKVLEIGGSDKKEATERYLGWVREIGG
jgi:hypothetical protein